MACPGRLNPWDMLTVTQHSSFSDWIFLYYLAKNMEPYLFREMLIDLANEMRQSDASDDDDEAVPLHGHNDESATENDKNHEFNKVLMTSEKNK